MNSQAAQSKWRPYPEYKNSGVEWLGDIPVGWTLTKLKYCVQELVPGGTPDSGKDDYWSNDGNGTSWVAISDMTKGFVITNTAKRVTDEGLNSKNLRVLPPGTLLYSIYASLGKVAVLAIPAVTNQAILGIIPKSEYVVQEFLARWFQHIEPNIAQLSSSNTQDNLNTEKVKNIQIFIPTIEEQQAIAAFLDRETEKIDALIEKKQRLISLLEEKRAAIISHAVTKGLNPDGPMEDLGVEWLGEIPTGWDTKQLKWNLDFLNSKRIPISSEERGKMEHIYPYYGASGVIDYVDDYIFDEELILIAEDGANLLSRSTKLAFLAKGKYWVNNHAHILKPKSGNTHFWAYLLESLDYKPYITGSAQPKLTKENLGLVEIPTPSIKEQNRIADFLDSEILKLDSPIKKIHQAINKLQEYRTALISAAVTGKIDVREASL